MTGEIRALYPDGVIADVPLAKYPNGEPLMHSPGGYPPTAILVRPRSMEAFVAAMFWVDGLMARGHKAPALLLPLVPGSRQDRINPTGDYLFTLKSVAGMINAREFPSVTVLDPHSDVTPALIERCVVVSVADIVAGSIGKDPTLYDGIISPDAGAEKRAGAVAKAFGVPLYHAGKSRNVATGAITGFWLQNIPIGHYFLVVDDLCDGGGTFIGLAEEIAKQTIAADLFVTHGLFTKGTADLTAHYGRVITTDSVLHQATTNEKAEHIPVCEKLLFQMLPTFQPAISILLANTPPSIIRHGV